MSLLLLRHGESEGNRNRLIQGWLEYSLTPLGREQAEMSGRYLESLDVAVLYSSPLRRARETADVVAKHTGHNVIELPDLREYHFGEAEGLIWDEARDRWGLEGRDWGRSQVPGEEGVRGFRSRVTHQINELLNLHANDTAICVVHGGVIGAIVAWICDLSDEQYAQIFTANCGISIISKTSDSWPSISLLNEVCHLRDLGEVQKEPWLSQ